MEGKNNINLGIPDLRAVAVVGKAFNSHAHGGYSYILYDYQHAQLHTFAPLELFAQLSNSVTAKYYTNVKLENNTVTLVGTKESDLVILDKFGKSAGEFKIFVLGIFKVADKTTGYIVYDSSTNSVKLVKASAIIRYEKYIVNGVVNSKDVVNGFFISARKGNLPIKYFDGTESVKQNGPVKQEVDSDIQSVIEFNPTLQRRYMENLITRSPILPLYFLDIDTAFNEIVNLLEKPSDVKRIKSNSNQPIADCSRLAIKYFRYILRDLLVFVIHNSKTHTEKDWQRNARLSPETKDAFYKLNKVLETKLQGQVDAIKRLLELKDEDKIVARQLNFLKKDMLYLSRYAYLTGSSELSPSKILGSILMNKCDKIILKNIDGARIIVGNKRMKDRVMYADTHMIAHSHERNTVGADYGVLLEFIKSALHDYLSAGRCGFINRSILNIAMCNTVSGGDKNFNEMIKLLNTFTKVRDTVVEQDKDYFEIKMFMGLSKLTSTADVDAFLHNVKMGIFSDCVNDTFLRNKVAVDYFSKLDSLYMK